MRLVIAGGGAAGGRPAQLPIRVVVADKHRGMRRALRLLLAPEADFEVAAEASSLASALHQLRRHRPHVLVLDPHTLDGSALDVVRRFRRQAPGTAIVVATIDDCAALAINTFQAGAIGFVLKDTADTELATAIRRAARGNQYASPRVSWATR